MRHQKGSTSNEEEIMSAKVRSKSPMIEKERSPSTKEQPNGEEVSQDAQAVQVKKERKSEREKVTFKKGADEGSKPLKVKNEHGSKTEKMDDEYASPEKSKPRKARKEGRSKTEKVADLKDKKIVSTEERSKPRVSKRDHRSKVDEEAIAEDEIALSLEDDSKKKKKLKKRKLKKKIHDVLLTNKNTTNNGLSAMVEPWMLLTKVVESHRDEVHVLKGIMDLRAAKTGDRTMLQQLETLLTKMDKERM